MFCKNCGMENLSTANYCIHDGTLLKSTPVKFRLKENKSSFCSECSGKTISGSNYCTECGSSNAQYTHEKGFASPKELTNMAAVLPKKWPGFKFTYFKNSLLPALIAILLVFGLSFSVMNSSEKVFNSLLGDSLEEMDFEGLLDMVASGSGSELPEFGKLFGISDIVMASNLQNPVFTVSVDGSLDGETEQATAEAEATNGFLLYLLIPFIGLFAAGIIASRRTRSTSQADHLTNALGIAAIYALFMTIFSLFAGFSYDFSTDRENFELSLDINTNYSFFRTLFMTFVFGFCFSGLGILFAVTFRKTTGHLSEWLPYGEAIHQALAIPFRGILLFSIVIFAYLSSKITEIKEAGPFLFDMPFEQLIEKSTVLIATISVQLGSYFWNLLHFTPITFMMTEERSSETISFDIFSGVEPGGEAGEFIGLKSMMDQTDIGLYLKLAMLIPIALFIWAGFKIARKPEYLKKLVIFSVMYAAVMSLLAAFTDLGFALSVVGMGSSEGTQMSMELGFGPAGTFIKSLLFSFVFAFIGTLINKLKRNG